MVNVPFLPPFTPYVLPAEPFEQMIGKYGARFTWMKGHDCPCVFGNQTQPGSPDPACRTCLGKGTYWDAPTEAFMALLTFIKASPSPDEPGSHMDEDVGLSQRADPTLTIPFTAGASGAIWRQASLYDAFVEVDSISRFYAGLQKGRVTSVPYNQGLTVPATGAVTVYNTNTNLVEPVSGYAVSGAAVTLPSTYPEKTSYTVEFYANPVYIAFRKAGGLPHVRPFGGGEVNLPRRFRVQTLDLWTRGNDRNPFPSGP